MKNIDYFCIVFSVVNNHLKQVNMKKYIFLLLLIPVWVSAQNRQTVEAASGEDLSKKVSTQMQYLLPEFTEGNVFYKGQTVKGKLNYNMLLGEMQFMENGQVSAFANSSNVIVVIIGNRKLYPFDGKEFTEELMSAGQYQLRVRRKGSSLSDSKKGAYGMESSTSATSTCSTISSGGRTNEMSAQRNIQVTLKYFYYLVGSNGKHILIKDAKTFTKQFPAHRTLIEEFVKEHNTQFDNEDDLRALLEYCSKL